MMLTESRKRWVIFGLLVVMVLAAAGCASGEPERLWLKTSSWSRAIHLGETRTVAPPPAVVSEDGKVHTVLFDLLDSEDPEADRERVYPWLITLEEDGRIENRVNLNVQIGTPEISRLVWDEDRFKLFWIDSYQLYLLEFDQYGQIDSEITRLSTEERIGSFDFSRNAEGNLILWYAGNRQKPGIYQLEFTGNGIEKSTIDREGVRVSLIQDQAGNLHATWARYPWGYGTLGWYYGYVPEGDVTQGEVEQIFSRGVSNAVRIEGPVIGLDQELVYVYWSETIVSGLDAGNRTTFYQAFPLGAPEQAAEPQLISVPRTDKIEPTFHTEDGLDTGPRISLEAGNFDRNAKVYREMAHVLEAEEKDFGHLLAESQKQELMGIKIQADEFPGYIEKIVINSFVNDDLVCEKCQELAGREFPVDEPIEKIPLPAEVCESEVGCRCMFGVKTGDIEKVARESRRKRLGLDD